MRVVFAGTGDICIPSFGSLRRSRDVQLVGLITQPDRPTGRHRALTGPRVKALALEGNIPVLQPERLRSAEGTAAVRALDPELIVVMAYGQILSREVLDIPRLGCLNLHASLLPRHRGASPVHAAILCGDAETGVSVMQMEEGLDTGPVLLRRSIPILPRETGGELHDRLAHVAADSLEAALEIIRSGQALFQPQDEALASYAPKLDRESGRIDWARPAVEIDRQVRAFDPWPGTLALLDGGGELKILSAEPVDAAQAAPPGEIVDRTRLVVACGEGSLRLLRLQVPGRKAMSAEEFLRGVPSFPRRFC